MPQFLHMLSPFFNSCINSVNNIYIVSQGIMYFYLFYISSYYILYHYFIDIHYVFKKIMNRKNYMYKREDVVWSKGKGVKGLSYPQILCDICIGTCFFSIPACLNYTWFRVQ